MEWGGEGVESAHPMAVWVLQLGGRRGLLDLIPDNSELRILSLLGWFYREGVYFGKYKHINLGG